MSCQALYTALPAVAYVQATVYIAVIIITFLSGDLGNNAPLLAHICLNTRFQLRTIGRKVLFDLCVTKVDCRVLFERFFRGMQPVGLRKRLDNRVVRLIHLAVNAQA